MRVNNPELYVITGGPGAGKTTLLLELGKRGSRVAHEAARQIIQEQVECVGDALPWKNRQLYTELMLERSIESYLEHRSTAEPTFSDRGIPDSLCYARLIGLADQATLKRACDQYRYARTVFFAPAWREIYATDAERKQDFAEAERTAELMRAVYEECDYEVVELPKSSVTERADFVSKNLNPR